MSNLKRSIAAIIDLTKVSFQHQTGSVVRPCRWTHAMHASEHTGQAWTSRDRPAAHLQRGHGLLQAVSDRRHIRVELPAPLLCGRGPRSLLLCRLGPTLQACYLTAMRHHA